MVSAIGTDSLEAYEKRALELALCPRELTRLRSALAENRLTYPLFDTVRFTRNIERTYMEMWEEQLACKSQA